MHRINEYQYTQTLDTLPKISLVIVAKIILVCITLYLSQFLYFQPPGAMFLVLYHLTHQRRLVRHQTLWDNLKVLVSEQSVVLWATDNTFNSNLNPIGLFRKQRENYDDIELSTQVLST